MSQPVFPEIRSRLDMIRFFNGYAGERMEELDERKLKRPLVKTHLLEIPDGENALSAKSLEHLFARHGANLKPIEEGLFSVGDELTGEIGFLEHLTSRIVALYSTHESSRLKKWVRNLVLGSPEIDHVWFSGLTLGVLWRLVVKLTKPHRFTKLVFTHASVFDVDSRPGQNEEDDEDEEETCSYPNAEDMPDIVERRDTRFQLVDRVGVVEKKLEQLQDLYSPLYAISQLRFPSPVGRGGHDFYYNGQVTNRSGSFRDHRSHLLFVVRIYEKLLKSTEEQAWYSIRESVGVPGQFRRIVGSPLTIRFKDPLNTQVFDYWIAATFERKRNRFRLWGHPIRLGPTKVHVYGVDRHLWQPLFLELTSRGCTAIIPKDTCGNTIHRLVTNIQRFLDPGAEVYIGDKPLKKVVEESTEGVPYDIDAK